MKKVLFLVNHDIVIYNFRLEVIERLISDGHEVHISSPYGERIDDLVKLGCKYYQIDIFRHGTNPLQEIKLLKAYKRLIAKIRPDIVLTYTIKPNIYGGIACQMKNIPYVANITGLGTAVENTGMIQKISILLYRYALRKSQKVFFQNTENQQFFVQHKIALDRMDLLSGSGVNLKRFLPLPYPSDETIEFVFISRIMKEKGIEQFLEAAKVISKKFQHTRFHICGFCEDEYKGKLNEFINAGTVIYHGLLRDVKEILVKTHCTIHPTFYPEGISNVLLESAACARPLISTDRSGCREVIEDGVNGYIIPQQDTQALISAIEKFIRLSNIEREKMGLCGRLKVEKEFDRQIVVEKYIDEINKVDCNT